MHHPAGSTAKRAENILGVAPMSLKLHILGMMDFMYNENAAEPRFAEAIGRRVQVTNVSWSDNPLSSSKKRSVQCEVVCALTVEEG